MGPGCPKDAVRIRWLQISSPMNCNVRYQRPDLMAILRTLWSAPPSPLLYKRPSSSLNIGHLNMSALFFLFHQVGIYTTWVGRVDVLTWGWLDSALITSHLSAEICPDDATWSYTELEHCTCAVWLKKKDTEAVHDFEVDGRMRLRWDEVEGEVSESAFVCNGWRDGAKFLTND